MANDDYAYDEDAVLREIFDELQISNDPQHVFGMYCINESQLALVRGLAYLQCREVRRHHACLRKRKCIGTRTVAASACGSKPESETWLDVYRDYKIGVLQCLIEHLLHSANTSATTALLPWKKLTMPQ